MLLRYAQRAYLSKVQPLQCSFFATKKTAPKTKDYSKLTHYEILNINPSANQKQLKLAYYELAKKFHPDTYRGTDTEYFKYIQKAYETLKNPEKRKEYDFKSGQSQEGMYTAAPSGEGSTGEDAKKKGHFEDIEVDENMNFDEEYSKFFGKPREHTPEEIVVQEHIFLKQLNREERMRFEYTHFRNNIDLNVLKFAHQQGYDDTLKDVIHLANKRVEMTDEVKQRMKEAEEKKGSYRLTLIKMALVGILIPTLMIAFHKRMSADKDRFKKLVEFARAAEEAEIRQVQQSFIFDDDKKK